METVASIILPFTNEIASVLTSSGLKMFKNLYVNSPTTNSQKSKHLLIDFIALSGIILSAVRTAEKHGKLAGIVKGVGVLIIAFIIPNFTIHSFMKNVCWRCSPSQKMFVGLLLIAGLTGFEYLFDRFIVESLSAPHQNINPHDEPEI